MNPKNLLRKSYLKLWFPSKSSFHLIFQNYHYVSTTVIQNATFFNIMFLLGSWAYLEMLMNRSVFSVKRGWEGIGEFQLLTLHPHPDSPYQFVHCNPLHSHYLLFNLCLFAFEQDQSVDNITGSFITVHRLEKLNIFLFVVGEAN